MTRSNSRHPKNKKRKEALVLNTHDVGVDLPMNTKYLSGNPISRWLIRRFVGTVISMVTSKIVSVDKILDVGCGEGLVPRQLRRLWPSADFYGLDIDPQLLAVARQLVPDLGCVTGSIDALPFADETYDLVCCTEVLEHLERPMPALSEINRVGKGYFLFSVPNEPLWRMANMIRGAYWPELGNSPGHLNHWNTSKFIHILSKNFMVIDIERPFPWIMILCQKK